ncbi:hypothetical protein GCK72_015053 [Caenorhabditis remanei]|uniref:Uncharacterized protein n=1 Tax=Caenorhabditis remanei TaxID=31234 RepID=A0A6A5GVB6_CAERE|nr:hypothetical protein GCK72_015053 [Caenorhabditis remanei]KAF1758594.1 hypothetical protein GCK72_015053 [Caenorhabditis remanei]
MSGSPDSLSPLRVTSPDAPELPAKKDSSEEYPSSLIDKDQEELPETEKGKISEFLKKFNSLYNEVIEDHHQQEDLIGFCFILKPYIDSYKKHLFFWNEIFSYSRIWTFVLQVLGETKEVALKTDAFYVCRDIAEQWSHSDNSESVFRGRRAEFYVQRTLSILEMAESTEIVSIVDNILHYFATSNKGTESMITNGLFRKVKNHLKRARMSKNLAIELSPCHLSELLKNIERKRSMVDWIIKRLRDTSSPKTEHCGTFSYYSGTCFLVTTLETVNCDDVIAKLLRDYYRSVRLGGLSVLQILSCAVEASYQNPEHAIHTGVLFEFLEGKNYGMDIEYKRGGFTSILMKYILKNVPEITELFSFTQILNDEPISSIMLETKDGFEEAIHFKVLLDQLAPYPLLLATDKMDTAVYKLKSFCTKTVEGDNGHALAFVWKNGRWWKMNSGRKEATDFSVTSVVNDILIAIYEKDEETM